MVIRKSNPWTIFCTLSYTYNLYHIYEKPKQIFHLCRHLTWAICSFLAEISVQNIACNKFNFHQLSAHYRYKTNPIYTRSPSTYLNINHGQLFISRRNKNIKAQVYLISNLCMQSTLRPSCCVCNVSQAWVREVPQAEIEPNRIEVFHFQYADRTIFFL